jgi:hypothetical protein
MLGVPGAPYSLLLPRSIDFDPFLLLVFLRYGSAVDRICLMHVLQTLWDRAEPAGFLNLLKAQPEKSAIFQYGLGDSQVSWLGTYAQARSVGAAAFTSQVLEGNETLYGFEVGDINLVGPYSRLSSRWLSPLLCWFSPTATALLSAQMYDDDAIITNQSAIMGVVYPDYADAAPMSNTPPPGETDTHGFPRTDSRALLQMDRFFRTGEIANYCEGPCICPGESPGGQC